jgi:predicted chitinase
MTFTTVKRIKEVYSYRLSLCIQKVNSGQETEPKIAKGSTVTKLAQACVRNPTLLADIVYGGREGTPWMQGSRYIGRSPLQVTHLNNYLKVCNEIRQQPGGENCPDLVAQPQALELPEWGVRAAFADWMIKGLHEWADRDDVDIVSDILNTGNHRDNVKPHGLQERRRWLAKAAARWPREEHRPVPATALQPAPAAQPAPEPVVEDELVVVSAPQGPILRPGDRGVFVKALQERLKELGYFSGLIDGKYGPLTERAVTNFQREHGLVPDGIVGDRTRQALDRSAPLDLGERADLDEKDLLKRGSRIVKFGRRIRAFGKWLWGITFGALLGETTGFGVIENAMSVGERINAFVDKFNVGGPKFWILLTLVVVSVAGFLISKWGDETVKARVDDARKGANLAR